MDLESLKADFEKGVKYDDLATKYGITKGTISKYKKKRGWKRGNKKMETKWKQNKKVSKEVSNTKLSDKKPTDDKWKKFCLLYLQYYNATKAYQETYNCSYDTARFQGSLLLAKPNIKAFLNKMREEQSSELFISSTELIKREIKMLYSSLKDYINIETVNIARTDYDNKPVVDTEGNQIIDHYNQIYVENPDEKDWSLVSEFHDGKDGTVIKLPDKVKLLKDLLDRLPDNEIHNAKLRKIKNDARLSELKAKALDDNDDAQMSQLSKFINKLEDDS